MSVHDAVLDYQKQIVALIEASGNHRAAGRDSSFNVLTVIPGRKLRLSVGDSATTPGRHMFG